METTMLCISSLFAQANATFLQTGLSELATLFFVETISTEH